MSIRPFSQASENNRPAIEPLLIRHLGNCKRVLEVGSGTGQHAVYFGRALPHLVWQTSDLLENHEGILRWLDEEGGDNVRPPLLVNALEHPWPGRPYDAVYTANTFHIMPWEAVQSFFKALPEALSSSGKLLVYGPFNYGGEFTSESNRRFEGWLKERGAHQGIRDFEKIVECAEAVGLELLEDNEMPANNRLLVFRRG